MMNSNYPAGGDAALKRQERREKAREDLEEYISESAWTFNTIYDTDISEEDWSVLVTEGVISDQRIAKIADLAEGKSIEAPA